MLEYHSAQINQLLPQIYFVNFVFNLSSLEESDLNNQYPRHAFVCNISSENLSIYIQLFLDPFQSFVPCTQVCLNLYSKCKIVDLLFVLSFCFNFKTLSKPQNSIFGSFQGEERNMQVPQAHFLSFVA